MKTKLRQLVRKGAPVLVAAALVGVVVVYTIVTREQRAEFVQLPMVGGGVTLSRLSAEGVATGPAVQGQVDDYLLEARGLRVVVGGEGRGAERTLRHASILDVA
ncbi:MAG TPA: hypothetical protein PKA88_39280, partial [Polyangiaceae bacterium]|nr:hypothetical protein [Polyangiaceae bacterium]